MRAYGQLARAGGREWLLRGTLDRQQTHALLSATLLAVVRDVLPLAPRERPKR